MFRDLVLILTIIFDVLLCIALLVVGFQAVNVTCFENVPVKCYVDGNLVYDGISAGINVLSTGRTTRVDIKGGFLYFFPKAFYVSNNVKLEGIKGR